MHASQKSRADEYKIPSVLSYWCGGQILTAPFPISHLLAENHSVESLRPTLPTQTICVRSLRIVDRQFVPLAFGGFLAAVRPRILFISRGKSCTPRHQRHSVSFSDYAGV